MKNIQKIKRGKKTKKIKKGFNKAKIWDKFSDEINKNKLELLFSEKNTSNREFCELCNSSLQISDERFLVCTNDKCGTIYKDCLDMTAEWRYYGADDNNMRDPTRCGMPINPLLRESSYACKILSTYKSSYQMKRIKRYITVLPVAAFMLTTLQQILVWQFLIIRMKLVRMHTWQSIIH